MGNDIHLLLFFTLTCEQKTETRKQVSDFGEDVKGLSYIGSRMNYK